MIIPLNSINPFIFVVVKYCIVFEVRTEYLNNVKTSVSFKGSVIWWLEYVVRWDET
jgi:hypothetical protein